MFRNVKDSDFVSHARLVLDALDKADTAFAVLNVGDLTSQGRKVLLEAWAAIQEVQVALEPDSIAAQVTVEEPKTALNVMRRERAEKERNSAWVSQEEVEKALIDNKDFDEFSMSTPEGWKKVPVKPIDWKAEDDRDHDIVIDRP